MGKEHLKRLPLTRDYLQGTMDLRGMIVTVTRLHFFVKGTTRNSLVNPLQNFPKKKKEQSIPS